MCLHIQYKCQYGFFFRRSDQAETYKQIFIITGILELAHRRRNKILHYFIIATYEFLTERENF